MLGHLLSGFLGLAEATIRLDGPPPPEEEAALRSLMDAFFTAHHGTLRGWDRERLMATAAALPWDHRLFFWEGHAFGCAAKRAFRVTSAHVLDQYRAPGYRYMLWTGLGFYNGLARQHWLPTVSMDDPRWAAEADFHVGRPLELGGETFGLVLRRVDPSAAIQNADDDEVARVGLAMGVGRVLWFHYAHRYDRLVSVLERHPELAEDLCVGLGVAITYTQLSRPERIFDALDALPAEHQTALTMGVRLALAAGVRENAEMEEGIRALPAPLGAWLAEGEAVQDALIPGPDYVLRLRAGLRAVAAPRTSRVVKTAGLA